MPMKPNTLEDFRQVLQLGKADECWPWQRGRTGAGYGAYKLEGRQELAHRLSYEIAKGPIPAGLVIDHLCRNRACQNPDHMEVVTNQENMLRGRWLEVCKYGHPRTPENTYISPSGNRQCRLCVLRWKRDWVARKGSCSVDGCQRPQRSRRLCFRHMRESIGG